MCSKDDEDKAPTKTELISPGNWYFTAYKRYTNGVEEDILTGMQTCEKDNFYVFRSDGSGEFNYGTQKCGSEPQNIPYTWVFMDNETKIKLTSNGKRLYPE